MQVYITSSQEAWEKENVLKLDWNESTLPILKEVKQSLIASIENDNLHWYPDITQRRLREKLCEFLCLDGRNLLITSSSDAAHELIMKSFIDKGDSILILYPTYDNFRVVASNSGGEVSLFSLSDTGEINISDLTDVISTMGPRMIYVCNPNNPHGTLLDHKDWLSLIQANPKSIFVVDEAYIDFSPNQSFISCVNTFDNVIITRTFSKAFGLASFRIGYLVASDELIGKLLPFYNWKSVNQLAQIAACETLKNKEKIDERIELICSQRDELIKFLGSFTSILTCVPSKANFVLLQFVNEENKKNFLKQLKEEEIYVRDLSHIKTLTMSVRITVPTGLDYVRLKNVILRFVDSINEPASNL